VRLLFFSGKLDSFLRKPQKKKNRKENCLLSNRNGLARESRHSWVEKRSKKTQKKIKNFLKIKSFFYFSPKAHFHKKRGFFEGGIRKNALGKEKC
jgi:hypothetical protein